MTNYLSIGNKGLLDIQVSTIPTLLREFATFVRYERLEDRIRRIKQKLRGIAAHSPEISARYAFHLALDELYRRKRLGQKIVIEDIATHSAISFIAGALTAVSQMSTGARARFCSDILGSLKPDMDLGLLNTRLDASFIFDKMTLLFSSPTVRHLGAMTF
jgi:hypothetical protein